MVFLQSYVTTLGGRLGETENKRIIMLNFWFKKWSWSLRIIRSGCLWESSWNSIWLRNKMATFNGRWSLTRSGHYERVEWVYILSTLLGSFILTWTIHEVYCDLKMMNFSVDVLVYRPSAFPEKKKKKRKLPLRCGGHKHPSSPL